MGSTARSYYNMPASMGGIGANDNLGNNRFLQINTAASTARSHDDVFAPMGGIGANGNNGFLQNNTAASTARSHSGMADESMGIARKRKRARYEGANTVFSCQATNDVNPAGQLVPVQSSLMQPTSLSHLSTETLLQIAQERSDFSLVIKPFLSNEDKPRKSLSLDDLVKDVFDDEVELDNDHFEQLGTFTLQEIMSNLPVTKPIDSFLLEKFGFDNPKTERIMIGAMANALRGSTESLAEAAGVVKQVVTSLLEISSGAAEHDAETCRSFLNQWKDHSKTQARRLTRSLTKQKKEVELIDTLLNGRLSDVPDRLATLNTRYTQQCEIISEFVGNSFNNRANEAQWKRMKEFFPSPSFERELLIYADKNTKAALSPLQLDSIADNLLRARWSI